MSENKNYTSLQPSNNVVEIPESKFDALIVNEVVNRIINDELSKTNIKHKKVLKLKQWLSTHNMLKNETSIVCNVLKQFKINSSHEPFQKNTTNQLEINTHNQLALNESTLENFQTNQKMIAVIEDKKSFKIIIQKSDTRSIKKKEVNDYKIIDSIVINDSDDDVLVIDDSQETTFEYEPSQKSSTKNVSGEPIRFSNELQPVIDKTQTIINSRNKVDVNVGSQKTTFKYEPSQKSSTKNVSGEPIRFSNELQPIIDEAQTSINNINNLSKTKDSQHSKLKSMLVDAGNNCMNNEIRRKYKPGPKSKTKDSFYNLEAIPTVLNDYAHVEVVRPKTISIPSNFTSTQQSKKIKNYNTNFITKISNYPPPYPKVPPHNSQPSWKMVPSAPILTIDNIKKNTITLTWDMKLTSQIAKIQQYELYVCQETEKHPDSSMWKLIGTIEANELPMQCELDSFKEGFTYHFALRAVDIHQRRGPCSVGKSTI